jgi:hypothetical protein
LTHKGAKSLESKGPQRALFKSPPPPKIPNGDASENAPREVEGKAGGEPTAKAAEARRNDWRDL